MRQLFISFLFLATTTFGQKNSIPSNNNKGKFFIYWGWNRSFYTKSDIKFKGDDYNFTLDNVVAKDRQSAFSVDTYLNPANMTIPQTNFRMGYFLDDHWSITAGYDHMKYVMQQNQTVQISGEIRNSVTEYNHVFDDEQIVLKEDFLMFEHTDGLNYINMELRRSDKVLDLQRHHAGDIIINTIEGVGTGILFPRTNVTLLGNKMNDEFHLAGYGMGAMAGLNITFWKVFFIQSEVKGGFINMPDIRTTEFKSDRAKQHFFFLESNILFGFSFRLWKQPVTTAN
jgi:hypothetical protein